MRVKHEEGYQAILYKNKEFDLTPITGKNKLKDLVSACEKAREAGPLQPTLFDTLKQNMSS